MGVDQASRPLSWDVAMTGRVQTIVEPVLGTRRPALRVKVADRSAILVATPENGWEAALSIARAVAVDVEYRCIVVRCSHGKWQVWLTNQPVREKVCTQCGNAYSYRACGPTHALVWHEMQQARS